MTNSEKALLIFDSGFSCAQSVLAAYAEKFELSPEMANKISCGFGAGMARMQNVCGAVTGAYMVIGLQFGKSQAWEEEEKEKTYETILEFNKRFRQIHPSLICKELLGCDINTQEGKELYSNQQMSEKICAKCVAHAVEILDTLLN